MKRSEAWMKGYNYMGTSTSSPFEKGSLQFAEWLDGWTHRFRGIPIEAPLPDNFLYAYGSTPEQIDAIRAQLRSGHKIADDAAEKRDYELDPRIAAAIQPKKRGRPRIHFDKPVAPVDGTKKRRGRPPGSKNKPKGG